MKVKTDFGIQEIKPQKVFEHEGYKFAIIKRPEQYMGVKEPMIMQRVIEFTTSILLPVSIQRGDTLKIVQEKAIKTLDNFKSLGADLKTQLQGKEILNNV